jgi:single-strand DNA-binding protein
MLNRVILTGRLTKDLELKRTGSGNAVTTFSLAVDRNFKGQNGDKETDFFECVAWKQSAEYLCQYAGKGRLLAIEGRLQTRSWQDQSGNNRKTVEIVDDRAEILDSKKDSYAERNEEPNIPAAPISFAEIKENLEDMLPF